MPSYADMLKKNIATMPSVAVLAKTAEPNRSTIQKKVKVGQDVGIKMKKDGNVGNVYYIDVGVNLTHKNLNTRIERILKDSVKHNCRRMISISSSLIDSKRAIALVRKWNKLSNDEYKLYCTVGVHPHEASRTLKLENWVEDLKKLVIDNDDIVLAIGECGLDYDRMFSTKEDQIKVFQEQIKLARDLQKPLYLHERKAHEDFLKTYDDENGKDNIPGLVHCFTGGTDKAESYLKRGFYIGITGWLCDTQRSEELRKSLPNIPQDRLMVETDAPYLTPKDLVRKPYYNGPQYIPHISNTIVNILNLKDKKDKIKFEATVMKNVSTLFGEEF